MLKGSLRLHDFHPEFAFKVRVFSNVMATKDNKRPHVSTGDTPHKDKHTRAMHPKEQGHLRRSLFSDKQSNNEVKHCACLYIFVLLCTENLENILFTRVHVGFVYVLFVLRGLGFTCLVACTLPPF